MPSIDIDCEENVAPSDEKFVEAYAEVFDKINMHRDLEVVVSALVLAGLHGTSTSTLLIGSGTRCVMSIMMV